MPIAGVSTFLGLWSFPDQLTFGDKVREQKSPANAHGEREATGCSYDADEKKLYSLAFARNKRREKKEKTQSRTYKMRDHTRGPVAFRKSKERENKEEKEGKRQRPEREGKENRGERGETRHVCHSEPVIVSGWSARQGFC